MSGFGLRTVLPLLSGLHADEHRDLTATAAGRHAGLTAVAAATRALTGAVTALAAKHRGLAAADLTAPGSSAVADDIAAAARDALLIVTDMEPMIYAGSLTRRHGPHVLAGPCDCRRCGPNSSRLRLTRPFDAIPDMHCVRVASVQPAPVDEPDGLPDGQITALLDAAAAALPDALTDDRAEALLFSAALLTGRTRFVLRSWQQTIDQRLSDRFITSLDGAFAPWRRDTLVQRLDRAGATLHALQAHLREAARHRRTRTRARDRSS